MCKCKQAFENFGKVDNLKLFDSTAKAPQEIYNEEIFERLTNLF